VNSRDITRPENADYIKVSPLEPDGFTKDGYDIAGYDRRGYNAFGWDRAGYGRDGYNKEGRDRDGYYRTGWDRDGYDRDGYNSAGWDKDGYNKEGRDKDGFDRKDRQRQYQKERDREAAEERKARSRQFAKERLAGEIWAGGIFDGAFIGGANFIVRLGRELHNTLFPLGLMAEASFQTPDAIKIDSNVGGGLRLALDLTGDGGWYINLGLSVSGGVSFIDNAAVPYLHIRGFAPVILPLTSGVFIHFYPDGVDSAWYIGAKLRIP
jgi:hypothetical protein